MFDLGWSEMAMVAVLALLVIGPKDLPKVLRTVGQWVRKIRSIGADFQRQMDDAVREAGLDEVKKEVTKVSRFNVNKAVADTVDPGGKITKSLNETTIQASSPSIPTAPTKTEAGEATATPAPSPSSVPSSAPALAPQTQSAPETQAAPDVSEKAAAQAQQQQANANPGKES
ncbi:MAG: Sec-independent protein translocase protein TatB [Rhodospirillaceae bacterium]